MQTLLQQLLAGLESGCIYAVLALALVIVYQSTHLVNFAQGEMAMFYVFLCHTRIGLSMRAVAQNMESSKLAGIKVDRTLSIGWGLAALIGSVAGMISAPKLFLEPHMMSGVLNP